CNPHFLTGLAHLLVPAIERAFDRLLRRLVAEVLDSQQVVEQTGNTVLKAVESCERVLAYRDEKVAGRPEASERERKLLGERFRPLVARVVGEVLLELVAA